MKKILVILIAVIAVAALAVLIVSVLAPLPQEDAPDMKETTPAPTGVNTEKAEPEQAPDFTVYDDNNAPISLSMMQGKVTVVNFWATWCGYCVVEMPEFEQAYKTYGDEVNFMMVDLISGAETPEKAKQFIEENGYTFPVYYDNDQDAYAKYSLTSIPRTLIIAPDGTLLREYKGAMNKTTLYSIIEAALSKAD